MTNRLAALGNEAYEWTKEGYLQDTDLLAKGFADDETVSAHVGLLARLGAAEDVASGRHQ